MITKFDKKINLPQAGGLILILALLAGCGGTDPVAPLQGSKDNIPSNISGQVGDDNRYGWGLWEITVNTESMTAEIIPLRDGQIHYNVLQMLEGWACSNCVRIVNLSYNEQENLEVEIGIRHPYPTTRLDLTGRDVRGVAIFPGTINFPNNFVRNKNDVEKPLLASEILVNADGWTTHFNRETADEGTGLYDYKKGKMTWPTESTIQGNLHPFKYFSTSDYKRLFRPGYEVIATYELDIPFQSEFTFAYSVDASWSMPLEWPVTNPITDFPTSANAREAFQISMSIDSSTLTQQGGSANLTIDIFDHQGYETISVITVEAPDLWVGNKNIDPTTPLWSTEEQARYSFNFMNETGHAKTDEGGNPMLVVVEDIGMSVVGEDVRGYQIFKIPVQDVAKGWRPRDNTFDHLGFVGPGPTPQGFDVTIISDPVGPWAFVPGEAMILVADDVSETYVAYNRNFDNWMYLAGYPGSPNSWIKDVMRMDATPHGAFGATSDSVEVVDGEYLVKHCTHSHFEGGVYSTSWYTGSLDDVPPYLEYPGDVSAGFGTAAGDPIYSMYLFDATAGYLPPPSSLSIHRIGAPYNDPDEVQRAKIPMQNALNGSGGPFGISSRFFRGLGIDDEPVGEVNPYVAYVFAAENENLGGGMTNRELDIYRVNFSYAADLAHLKTYDNTMLGGSFPGPMLGDPEIIDVAVLPAYTNNVYMGAGQYPEHNWVAVLYLATPARWFIEIFDPFLPDGQWQVPIYYTGSFTGNAFAMDVDTSNFEIYVLHDDAPLGSGVPQLTCLEYY